MKIETKDVLNKWKLYTLTNQQGMKVRLLNYGGIITEIVVPNKDGVMENVVLGFKDYADYENNENFFGAITGRVAGRIQKDRKSTRLNSSHVAISYAVFFLKKK